MPIMQYYKKRKLIASAFELLHSDKKILTIALEYGFSNPESYTRAFQRYFGMTPSQFRAKRPLLGGRRLESGVLGLERLDHKTKRSDENRMELNKNNTILYGIRKIEHGAYDSNTMFPICVKAVSEYLGDNVSYAYITAATGAAFRLVWIEADGDIVMGWNFFQNDPEFASDISTLENGYFRCHTWWENTDTQAVMCIGALEDTSYHDRDIIKTALAVMETREENTYAKGIRAYEAWKETLYGYFRLFS